MPEDTPKSTRRIVIVGAATAALAAGGYFLLGKRGGTKSGHPFTYFKLMNNGSKKVLSGTVSGQDKDGNLSSSSSWSALPIPTGGGFATLQISGWSDDTRKIMLTVTLEGDTSPISSPWVETTVPGTGYCIFKASWEILSGNTIGTSPPQAYPSAD